MLNLDNIRRCRRFDRPFTFGLIEDPFLDLDAARALVGEFPSTGYEYRTHEGTHYVRRPLFVLGEDRPHQPEHLGPRTLELAGQIASPDYRALLGDVLSVDLEATRLEAWFWRYDWATGFVPHRDLESKLITQVFYMNDPWPASAGGRLRILRSESPDDVAFEIAPDLRLSTLIKRSDTSWHHVTAIGREAPNSRNTITVHFYRA
jgi:hypothetical protein